MSKPNKELYRSETLLLISIESLERARAAAWSTYQAEKLDLAISRFNVQLREKYTKVRRKRVRRGQLH